MNSIDYFFNGNTLVCPQVLLHLGPQPWHIDIELLYNCESCTNRRNLFCLALDLGTSMFYLPEVTLNDAKITREAGLDNSD